MPLARAGETAPSARLAALAWTPSRATRAWLTIRSFGLPADFTTVVEARAPEPAWRLTSCSHAEAGAEPTVSPATSPAPRTAERDATAAAEAGPAQHNVSATVSAPMMPRLSSMPDTCTDATLATAQFCRERV